MVRNLWAPGNFPSTTTLDYLNFLFYQITNVLLGGLLPLQVKFIACSEEKNGDIFFSF